jgi:hypothetical protein
MNIDTLCSNRPMKFSEPFDEVCARADRPEIAAAESADAVFTNGNDPVFSGQVGRKTGQNWPARKCHCPQVGILYDSDSHREITVVLKVEQRLVSVSGPGRCSLEKAFEQWFEVDSEVITWLDTSS